MHRRPIQCIVPPYIVERMAHCEDPQIRERALVALTTGSAVRAVRAFAQRMQTMLAAPSPTARKHRLVYDARGRDTLPGRLVRTEGQKKTADTAVNEAYDHSGSRCPVARRGGGADCCLDAAGDPRHGASGRGLSGRSGAW